MESFEVLKQAVNHLGVKAIASDMGLSTSLIYKWCQAKEDVDSCGADNPLDRIMRIYKLTGDRSPVRWLCQNVGGFFVENHPVEVHDDDFLQPLKATQEILSEFSQLLEVVSQSIEDDQLIDTKEAEKIRQVWETFKSITESFVVACEAGKYGQKREE